MIEQRLLLSANDCRIAVLLKLLLLLEHIPEARQLWPASKHSRPLLLEGAPLRARVSAGRLSTRDVVCRCYE